jgi:dicarboxylate transporter 10
MSIGTSVKTEVAPVVAEQQRRPNTVKKIHYPFWFGGSASCFAAGVTHPLDLGMLKCLYMI